MSYMTAIPACSGKAEVFCRSALYIILLLINNVCIAAGRATIFQSGKAEEKFLQMRFGTKHTVSVQGHNTAGKELSFHTDAKETREQKQADISVCFADNGQKAHKNSEEEEHEERNSCCIGFWRSV